MKNVSSLFKDVIKNGGPFYAYAKAVLSDGTELEFDSEHDLLMDSENFYQEAGGSGFPLGVAVAKTISIGIDNSDGRYSQYDFYYARITLYTEADLANGTTARINEGTFTVIDSVAPGEIIEITAYDEMYKADISYTSNLSYPASAINVLRDVCSKTGILLGNTSFANDSFMVQSMPNGLTCRQVIGYVAMIAGGNAVIESEKLYIKSYDLSIFDTVNLVSADGTLQGYIAAAQQAEQQGTYIPLVYEYATDPDIATDDVTITGLKTTGKNSDGEEVTYSYGTDSYALSIENPLIEGQEQAALQLIGSIVVGITVRPFSGAFSPDPMLQFMDAVYLIDKKDRLYKTFVTEHTFWYLGNSELANATESPVRNSGTYYSTATEVYRKAQAEVSRVKTEFEKAIENLSIRMDNSSGLFMTAIEQEDGSYIYYMHDKQTIGESLIIWAMSAEAMAVSTDGGKTWNAGLTVDGALIVKILISIGINADWINTGDLTVGGTSANADGSIKVYDANNKLICKIDKSGLMALLGEIGGWKITDNAITSPDDTLRLDSTTGTITGYEDGKWRVQLGKQGVRNYDAQGNLIGLTGVTDLYGVNDDGLLNYDDFKGSLMSAAVEDNSVGWAVTARVDGSGIDAKQRRVWYDRATDTFRVNCKTELSGGFNSGTRIMEQTVLWEGVLSTAGETITLSDNVNNYDIICVETATSNSTYGHVNRVLVYIPTSEIDYEMGPAYTNSFTFRAISASNAFMYNLRYSFSGQNSLYLFDTDYVLSNMPTGTVPFIKKIIGIKFVSRINYSTSEQCVGTWIDGKPLYQKTFNDLSISETPANTWFDIVNVAELNIKELISCSAKPADGSVMSISSMIDSGMLKGFFFATWMVDVVTIRYTKTTD